MEGTSIDVHTFRSQATAAACSSECRRTFLMTRMNRDATTNAWSKIKLCKKK